MSAGAWVSSWRLRFLLAACLALTLLSTTVSGGTARGSFAATLSSASPLIPVAMGAAIVIATGRIDLSVAGAISMHGTVILLFATLGLHPIAAYTVSFGFALVVGVSVSVLVVRLGIPSLIATLAASILFAGAALLIDGILIRTAVDRIGETGLIIATRTLPANYLWDFFGTPWVWALVIAIVAVFWRYQTLSGLRHLAVGFSASAATRAVLPVQRIASRAFLISSLSAWLTALLLMIGFQGGGWNPGAGSGMELTAILVAVMGGTNITGGTFDPFGVVVATLLWASLLQLQYVVPGLGPETQLLFTGVLVTLVAFSQSRRQATDK
jgi:simple sugar transport system permease protein